MPDFHDHKPDLPAQSVSEDTAPANPPFRSAFARDTPTTSNFRYRQNISTLFNPPTPTSGSIHAPTPIATPSEIPDQPIKLPQNWHTPMALPTNVGIQPSAIPNTSSNIQSDLQADLHLAPKAGLMSEEEYFAVNGDPEVSVRTVEVEGLGEVLRLPKSGYGMSEVQLAEKIEVKQVVTLPSWGVRVPARGLLGAGEREWSPSRQLVSELNAAAESEELTKTAKLIGEVGGGGGGTALAGRGERGLFRSVLACVYCGLLYGLLLYVVVVVGGSWLAMQNPSGY